MVTLLLSIWSTLQWLIWPLSTLKTQPTSYDHTNGPNKLLLISEWNSEGNLIRWATKTASYITIRLNLVRQGLVLLLVFFSLSFHPISCSAFICRASLKTSATEQNMGVLRGVLKSIHPFSWLLIHFRVAGSFEWDIWRMWKDNGHELCAWAVYQQMVVTVIHLCERMRLHFLRVCLGLCLFSIFWIKHSFYLLCYSQ